MTRPYTSPPINMSTLYPVRDRRPSPTTSSWHWNFMRTVSLLVVTKLSSTWVHSIICWLYSFLTHIDFSYPTTESNPSDFNHCDQVLCRHLPEWGIQYASLLPSYHDRVWIFLPSLWGVMYTFPPFARSISYSWNQSRRAALPLAKLLRSTIWILQNLTFRLRVSMPVQRSFGNGQSIWRS